jgi:hypothetical protein
LFFNLLHFDHIYLAGDSPLPLNLVALVLDADLPGCFLGLGSLGVEGDVGFGDELGGRGPNEQIGLAFFVLAVGSEFVVGFWEFRVGRVTEKFPPPSRGALHILKYSKKGLF